MLLPALLLLVSTQAGCRSAAVAPPSDGGVAVLSLDLDGDAVADEVRIVERQVELQRSKPRSVQKIAIDWGEDQGTALLPFGKLPLKGSPHREEALRFIEDAIFPTTCTTADPPLQRLLQQRQRGKSTPLHWVEGRAPPPSSYLLRQENAWLMFRTYCWTGDGQDPFGPIPLTEAASDGPLVVLKSCHGVVLADLEHDRHAWLYWLDQPIEKLRHKSIGDVVISDGVVAIDLKLDMLEFPDCVEARVRIADGSIKIVKGKRPEHWPESDPKGPRCVR